MTYLAKLGELTLKGSNIQEFENLLKHNTAKCLEGTGSKIILRAGRLYIGLRQLQPHPAVPAGQEGR